MRYIIQFKSREDLAVCHDFFFSRRREHVYQELDGVSESVKGRIGVVWGQESDTREKERGEEWDFMAALVRGKPGSLGTFPVLFELLQDRNIGQITRTRRHPWEIGISGCDCFPWESVRLYLEELPHRGSYRLSTRSTFMDARYSRR